MTVLWAALVAIVLLLAIVCISEFGGELRAYWRGRQVCREARCRLRSAGLDGYRASDICAEAAYDHPYGSDAWARAVHQDVDQLILVVQDEVALAALPEVF